MGQPSYLDTVDMEPSRPQVARGMLSGPSVCLPIRLGVTPASACPSLQELTDRPMCWGCRILDALDLVVSHRDGSPSSSSLGSCLASSSLLLPQSCLEGWQRGLGYLLLVFRPDLGAAYSPLSSQEKKKKTNSVSPTLRSELLLCTPVPCHTPSSLKVRVPYISECSACLQPSSHRA